MYVSEGNRRSLQAQLVPECCSIQSQKTQGFCVADFATLSDERRSRSKIFPLFIWIKEPCVRKFEGLERSILLGISQTILGESENKYQNEAKGICSPVVTIT